MSDKSDYNSGYDQACKDVIQLLDASKVLGIVTENAHKSLTLAIAALATPALRASENAYVEGRQEVAQADHSVVNRDARAVVGRAISPGVADTRVDPDGQQRGYYVLSDEERTKGFVRPVRKVYRHLKCNTTTKMGTDIAETYARDPAFYSGTFCVKCCVHRPVGEEGEFVWEDDHTQKVGT